MGTFIKKRTHLFLTIIGPALLIAWAITSSKAGDFNPNVFNRNGGAAGMVAGDGDIFNRNGRLVGKVDSSGKVFNRYGGRLGTVESEGKLFNRNGGPIGKVTAQGKAFNRNGGFVGRIEGTASLILMGGAAIVLLL
jgi:hypothetical protein